MASAPNTRLPNRPWWLIYVRAGFLAVIGLILLLSSHFSIGLSLLLGACLLITGLASIRFWQISRSASDSNSWFLLNGLLDTLVGIAMIVYHQDPADDIVLIFGFWSVLQGVFQAVETAFLFLGFQDTNRTSRDLGVIVINFVMFVLSGVLAFLVVSQPFGDKSVRYAGIPIILLGIALVVESRRLQADAKPEETAN